MEAVEGNENLHYSMFLFKLKNTYNKLLKCVLFTLQYVSI